MALPMLQERLRYKLFAYICDNNPDLLFELEEERRVTLYLQEKVVSLEATFQVYATEPEYVLEERCMMLLTKDLRPSRYNFICRVLEEEFAPAFRQLVESGTLKFEAVNLIKECHEVFEAVRFSETREENRLLYYAIAGAISEYFDRGIGSERTVQWDTTAGKN